MAWFREVHSRGPPGGALRLHFLPEQLAAGGVNLARAEVEHLGHFVRFEADRVKGNVEQAAVVADTGVGDFRLRCRGRIWSRNSSTPPSTNLSRTSRASLPRSVIDSRTRTWNSTLTSRPRCRTLTPRSSPPTNRYARRNFANSCG